MRIAIYTRLSPNPEKDDTVNQERELLEFAKRSDYEVVEVYTDIHVSGSVKGSQRKSFLRMMDDARKRKFDLVLFWSLDRLSREGALETLTYLDQLNKWGCNYKSYTEQYLDSCGVFGEAIIAIMAVIAKQERIRLKERTLAGLQTARDKGIKLGRAYATTKTENRPEPFEVVVAKNLRIRGWTLKKIAKKFNVSEATVSRYLKGIKTERCNDGN